MSWAEFLFGEKNPSASSKVFWSITAFVTILAIYGFNANFIVSRNWSIICHYLTAVLTSVCLVVIYILRSKNELKLAQDQTISRTLLGIIGGLFFIYLAIYLALAHGFPDLITRNFGAPHTTTATLNKLKYNGTKSCKYQLTGPYFENAFPSYMCISEFEFINLPNTPFDAIILGKSSFLGFHIQEWRKDRDPS